MNDQFLEESLKKSCGYVAERIQRCCRGKSADQENVRPISQRACVMGGKGRQPVKQGTFPYHCDNKNNATVATDDEMIYRNRYDESKPSN